MSSKQVRAMVLSDEELDHAPMTFGKHAGKTPSQVAEIAPSYLVWAFETLDHKPCSLLLYKECVKDAAEQRQHGRVAKDQDRE